jgi:hypothetical protein
MREIDKRANSRQNARRIHDYASFPCYHQENGSILIPLFNVNWKDPNSHVLVSNEAPEFEFIFCFMSYFYLNPILANWFSEHNSKYALFWHEESSTWYLEIYDKSLAALFKLTFG